MKRPRLLFGFEVISLTSGETTVGRDESCAITIGDASVSRAHACFHVAPTRSS